MMQRDMTSPQSRLLEVAGVSHEGRSLLIEKLHPDAEVQLIRERFNKFDSFAVAVYAAVPGYTELQKIGFISRSENKVIAEKLDRGVIFVATVSETWPFAGDNGDEIWMCEIEITELVEDSLGSEPNATSQLEDDILRWLTN